MTTEARYIKCLAERLDDKGLDILFGLLFWPLYDEIRKQNLPPRMEDLAYLHVLHLMGLECPHPPHRRLWWFEEDEWKPISHEYMRYFAQTGNRPRYSRCSICDSTIVLD